MYILSVNGPISKNLPPPPIKSSYNDRVTIKNNKSYNLMRTRIFIDVGMLCSIYHEISKPVLYGTYIAMSDSELQRSKQYNGTDR